MRACGTGNRSSLPVPGPLVSSLWPLQKPRERRAFWSPDESADEGIRFDIARKLGADYTINVDKTVPVGKALEITDGLGSDMLIETSGGSQAISQAFEIVRRMGRICAIGISGKQEVPIPYDRGISRPFVTISASPAVGPLGKRDRPYFQGFAPRGEAYYPQTAPRKVGGGFSSSGNLQAAKVILVP